MIGTAGAVLISQRLRHPACYARMKSEQLGKRLRHRLAWFIANPIVVQRPSPGWLVASRVVAAISSCEKNVLLSDGIAPERLSVYSFCGCAEVVMNCANRRHDMNLFADW